MTASALRDFVGGSLTVAFGALLWLWLIPEFVGEDPIFQLSVDMMPKLLAGLLILLGSLQLVGAVMNRVKDSGEVFPDLRELTVVFGLVLALSAATFFMAFLPYLVVTPVFVAILVWIYTPTRPLPCLAISLIGPGVVYFIIRHVFERMLP